MVLTESRAKLLSDIILADENKDKKLLEMDPNEALDVINAMGNDFTIDEINEFGDALKSYVSQGELNADDLDSVAGGVVGTVIAACAIAAGVGAAVGALERFKIW